MSLGSLSVRTRLTLWYAGVLALIVGVFSAAAFPIVKTSLYGDLDELLSRDLAAVEKVWRADPTELDELETRFGVALFEVAAGNRIRYQSARWKKTGMAAALSSAPASPIRSWRSPEGRVYRVGEISDRSFRAAVALDESAIRQTLGVLATILWAGIPCAIAIAILGGYFLAGRVLQPVGAMAETARRITADSLGERLVIENPSDEFGRLARVLNETLARVQASFDQLRRFTADASHELRTPLTAMRSVGEVALHKSLDPAGYRDVIGSMLEEVERLTRLVESLLTLTRAESGGLRLNRERVDLSRLAGSVAENLRVLAEDKDQALRVEAGGPVPAECDPVVLRQGLLNLLHNAIKFTGNRGAILVKTAMISPLEAAIEVKDSGPGIARAHRSKIFDRFYRVDEGRSREAGGVGLGLAIARWAIEANGGRIELESEEGSGSLFRIVLPLADAPR